MSEGIYNPEITIEYDFRDRIDITVDLHTILSSINELELKSKWNVIAGILKNIELPIDGLSDDDKTLIKTFLNKQIDRLEL